jgi:hypothetical protein
MVPSMSQTSSTRRPGVSAGQQGTSVRAGAHTQARLSRSQSGDIVGLACLAAIVLLLVLSVAARFMTWAGVLLLLAAAMAIAGWAWYVVASWRKGVAEARRQQELFVQGSLDQVDAMNGTEFEHFFARLLCLNGHREVRVIGGKHDGGIDVLSVDPDGRPMGYQLKRLKDAVALDVVRELLGSLAHEHRGRCGVIVSNRELTGPARSLARTSGIEVIDRNDLAKWIGRARNQIEKQGNAPGATNGRYRILAGHGIRVSGATVAIFAVIASAYAAASLRPAVPAEASAASPAAVVEANVAAINRHDWPAVWQSYAHRVPGYGSAYTRMVAGYRHTARDVVLSMNVRGDAVSAVVRAYKADGTVQIYDFSYVVHAGKISSGRSVLVHSTPPRRGPS